MCRGIHILLLSQPLPSQKKSVGTLHVTSLQDCTKRFRESVGYNATDVRAYTLRPLKPKGEKALYGRMPLVLLIFSTLSG
jgi:hypothetical protein